MSWGRNAALAGVLFLGWHGLAWAQTGCVPNPNLTAPPFVDGCPLPAAGLNNAFDTIGGRSCANIINHGGHRDNTGDNVAAFNAAKAASSCIYFPAGTYRFLGPITYATTGLVPSVTIVGDGPDVSILTWPNTVTTALSISLGSYQQSFHVRELSMTTGTTNLDTAISVRLTSVPVPPFQSGFAPNDLTNVIFRSSQGYWNQNSSTPITHSWAASFHDRDVSVIDFTGVKIWGPTPGGGDGWPDATGGTGIIIEGTTAGSSTNVFNFSKADINYVNTGVIIGTRTQGYQISLSNFVGNRVAIFTGAVNDALAQLSITTSQFNCLHAIILDSRFPAVQVTNSTFFVNGGGSAVNMLEEQIGTMITGNVFLGALPLPSQIGQAIVFQPTNPYSDTDSTPPVIVGNNFYRLLTGIFFGPNMGPAIVHSNEFHRNATNIQNTSTNKEISITGATRLSLPLYGTIIGAVNNGSGFIRVTLDAPTDLISGMMVSVGSLGGIAGLGPNDPPLVTQVQVIDSTHVDLSNLLFNGAYTSGGRLSTLP